MIILVGPWWLEHDVSWIEDLAEIEGRVIILPRRPRVQPERPKQCGGLVWDASKSRMVVCGNLLNTSGTCSNCDKG